jgi:hypothetical protein
MRGQRCERGERGELCERGERGERKEWGTRTRTRNHLGAEAARQNFVHARGVHSGKVSMGDNLFSLERHQRTGTL